MTIGTMVPFISFVSNPNKILEIEFLRRISDFFNFQQTDQLFIFISFSFLIIILFSGLIKIFCIKKINDFGGTLNIELGKKLYKEILYQDYEYHLNTNSSQLISTQIQQLESSLAVISESLLLGLSVLNILGITISLFIIDSKIIICIFTFSLLFYVIASKSTKKYVDVYGKIIFETRKNIIRIVQESLGFIRQIILDDSHSFFIQEYDKNNIQNTLANTNSNTISQIPRYLMESLILSGLVISIIFIYLSGIDFYNYLTKGGAFILGLQKLLPLFQKTFRSVFFIRQEKLSVNSVVQLLKETKKHKHNSRDKLVNNFEIKNKIRFENISFSYKENTVLENINLVIKRGEVIGIVGKTGTGKSTFIDILLGLIKPNSGYIYIDEKKMDPNLFRRFRLSVSSVPQDYFLLDRTIEENIVFGKSKSKIDYKLLNKVVKISMLQDLVNSLSYGLQTFVGENGIRLSGGQKQRLAIARALYKKHSLLILDEATSSVDSETEKSILDNIITDNPEITVLMIAHRLQTLKNCDYILEIKNKKLIKYQNIKEYKYKYDSN
ncbi:Hypothetical protein P9515_01541 [Prochlorococcus marinus str. MIT 9515]|uniref:ABC transporter ATP-binding protein n=1 Tax=Prochlorococcus marinus (strain MIT 9515) TaxID=167542 RepID=A2BUA2_PROM5|nr:Hypothetical protein P9515_01541 [Prochlorococcus marinus str. MIT 9515]